MSTSLQLPDLMQLSVAERILVVEQIWDSIAAEQSPLPVSLHSERSWTVAWRRIATHQAKVHLGKKSKHVFNRREQSFPCPGAAP